MTVIKLTDGTRIDALTVKQEGCFLLVDVDRYTVSELEEMFSVKERIQRLVLLTASGIESGCLSDYFCFVRVITNADETHTVCLRNPNIDVPNADDPLNGSVTTTDVLNTMLGVR